jgi:uncharacterized membrane protein
MSKGRLEAFSDGVIAVIITILVLDLRAPESGDWSAIAPLAPVFLSYVLSFVYLGIYWNNHHHLLQAATRVHGVVLWANLHLLFWLSLVPFVTGWMNETHFATIPVALYGSDLLLAGLAYIPLARALVAAEGEGSQLRLAAGPEMKGWVSCACYALGVVAALLVSVWVALALYAFVALMWFIPNRQIERTLRGASPGAGD